MNPDQTRLNRIGSIDLELLRSRKTIVSRKVDNLDEISRSRQRLIKNPTITTSENTLQKSEALTFREHETIKLDMPHDDAVVISLNVGGTILSKILVDTGSAVNIISQKKNCGRSNSRSQRAGGKQHPLPVSKEGRFPHSEW